MIQALVSLVATTLWAVLALATPLADGVAGKWLNAQVVLACVLVLVALLIVWVDARRAD